MNFHAYDLKQGEHVADVTAETFEGARITLEKVMESQAEKFPFVLIPVEGNEES